MCISNIFYANNKYFIEYIFFIIIIFSDITFTLYLHYINTFNLYLDIHHLHKTGKIRNYMFGNINVI